MKDFPLLTEQEIVEIRDYISGIRPSLKENRRFHDLLQKCSIYTILCSDSLNKQQISLRNIFSSDGGLFVFTDLEHCERFKNDEISQQGKYVNIVTIPLIAVLGYAREFKQTIYFDINDPVGSNILAYVGDTERLQIYELM